MRAIIVVLLALLSGCKADRMEISERTNRCDGNGGLVDMTNAPGRTRTYILWNGGPVFMINAAGRTRTYILFCKDGSVKWEKP